MKKFITQKFVAQKFIAKIFLSTLVILTLSSCDSSYHQTGAAVSAKPFKIAAGREYQKIAERAALRKDYTNASYFRRKAREAQSGMFDALPENPQDWRVKGDVSLDNLYNERIALLKKLENSKLVKEAPNSAAKALTYYDCWIVESANSVYKSDFDCQKNYKQVISYLNEIEIDLALKSSNSIYSETKNLKDGTDDRLFSTKYKGKSKYAGTYSDGANDAISDKKTRDAKKAAAAAKAKAAKIAAEKAAKGENTANAGKSGGNFITDESGGAADVAYIIYFDKGADKMKPDSEKELEKALAEIKSANPKRISINGHTDKETDDNTSMVLSKKRADNIRDIMAQKGVDKGALKTFGFGKSDNSSSSTAGQNRVEITFKGK